MDAANRPVHAVRKIRTVDNSLLVMIFNISYVIKKSGQFGCGGVGPTQPTNIQQHIVKSGVNLFLKTVYWAGKSTFKKF